jgi:hypothetical protein
MEYGAYGAIWYSPSPLTLAALLLFPTNRGLLALLPRLLVCAVSNRLKLSQSACSPTAIKRAEPPA